MNVFASLKSSKSGLSSLDVHSRLWYKRIIDDLSQQKEDWFLMGVYIKTFKTFLTTFMGKKTAISSFRVFSSDIFSHYLFSLQIPIWCGIVALKSKMKYPSSLLHPANTTFEVCSKQHQQEKKSFLLKFSFVHQSCIITKAASWRTASKAASEQNCNGEWPQATSFFYLFFQNWLDRIGQLFS